ncbi:MAG TPA: FRG domain-containing protein [Parafilimonas sp.]|nr:FRG domain-containing protein [Parafilimonas sp.]
MLPKIKEGKRLDKLEDFLEIIDSKICPHFVFRGVSSIDYRLFASIARKLKTPYTREEEILFLQKEKTLFEQFKSRATIHTMNGHLNDWQWLTLAQHYGLGTRLLDWTENPLMALYFTIWENKNLDKIGGLYVHHLSSYLDIYKPDSNPFELKKSGFIISPYVTTRIAAQAAVFSIHATPWEELDVDINEREQIMVLPVTQNFKKKIIPLLPKFGLNKRTVFADLDSYASEIDESYRKIVCKHQEYRTIEGQPQRLNRKRMKTNELKTVKIKSDCNYKGKYYYNEFDEEEQTVDFTISFSQKGLEIFGDIEEVDKNKTPAPSAFTGHLLGNRINFVKRYKNPDAEHSDRPEILYCGNYDFVNNEFTGTWYLMIKCIDDGEENVAFQSVRTGTWKIVL